MFTRRVIALFVRLLQIVACVIAVTAIGLVMLTRTEMGREELHTALERQFNRALAGRLEVGQLSGNPLTKLSALDVSIRDSTGKAVFQADSVTFHPILRGLLRRRFRTRRITLFHPRFTLHQDGTGTWNLASVFTGTRSNQSAPSGRAWSFNADDIEIVGGNIRTRSSAPPPSMVQTGDLFDWTNASLEGLDARLAFNWTPNHKRIEVLNFEAHLSSTRTDIEHLRGAVVVEEDKLTLESLQLKTGASNLDASGSIAFPDALGSDGTSESAGASRSDETSPLLHLDLRGDAMHGGDLGRIVPMLSLESAFATEARLKGPLNDLSVEHLKLETGSSSLSMEGTLRGLPDSLDYALILHPATVHGQDVHAIRPDLPIPSFGHLGPVAYAVSSEGIIRFGSSTEAGRPHWESENRFHLESVAGSLDGEVKLAVDKNRFALEGSAAMASLDAGHVLRKPNLASDLTGQVAFRAGGPSPADAEGQIHLELTPSQLTSRQLDTLRVNLVGSLRAFKGDLFVKLGHGKIDAQVQAELAPQASTYRIEGETTQLDVAALVPEGMPTSTLNTRFHVDGKGLSWKTLEGDAQLLFAPSTLSFGGAKRRIPAHGSSLSIRQKGSDTPRIVLEGDVVELVVTGDLGLEELIGLGHQWTSAMITSVQRELAKSIGAHEEASPPSAEASSTPVGDSPASAATHGPDRPTNPDSDPATLADSEPGSATFAGPEPDPTTLAGIRVETRLRVLRSDILAAFLPVFPGLHANLQMDGSLRLGPDLVDVDLRIQADSLHLGSTRTYDMETHLSASGQDVQDVFRTLRADFSASASALHVRDNHFIGPTLESTLRQRGLDVSLRAHVPDEIVPLRFQGRMDLLEDRNRLSVEDIQLAAEDQIWGIAGTAIVDFYRDAIRIPSIRIDRVRESNVEEVAHLEIAGTLSSAPGDTLTVRAANIHMHYAGAMMGLGDAFGGYLGGQLAFTGMNRQPELTGRIVIEPLTYQEHPLGRLSVTSQYIPGSPDVALQVQLAPVEIDPLGPDPQSSLSIEPDPQSNPPMGLDRQSELDIQGTFRLPSRDSTNETRGPGGLDLDLRIGRVDAFFFEYLFEDAIEDVDGFLSGTGHIGGDFSTPMFAADISLQEARFHVPEYDLTYDTSGPIYVDQQGIHLQSLALSDTGGGRAFIDGSILFNEYRFFSFDLHGNLDQIRIMNVQHSLELPLYGEMSVTGDVHLTGPLPSASLQSTNLRTTTNSRLYIPISESEEATDTGFIVFADSTGRIPDLAQRTLRRNLLVERPQGEREFLDGLDMDIDILAPEGSTVHLVIDPLLGDVINAVGSGEIQLSREEGDFYMFGTFSISSGDYLFTAGRVFARPFLIDSGTITWDGDPLNASMNILASYRTRASTAGLPIENPGSGLIPLVIGLGVSGRATTPIVDITLSIDQSDRELLGSYEGLEAVLNQPEQATQYATSVLLTNSFLLASNQPLEEAGKRTAFNSLSQLVNGQLNRYLQYALPNVQLDFAVDGERVEDLDITYGLVLRLVDERVIIRGHGIYQNDALREQQHRGLDEFIIEVRLSPLVSVEVFYRREGNILDRESLNTSTTGFGLSYQTEFSTWRRLFERLSGQK